MKHIVQIAGRRFNPLEINQIIFGDNFGDNFLLIVSDYFFIFNQMDFND